MPQHHRACFRAKLKPAVWALVWACGGSAVAQETSPYYIGVRQAFNHDSNVLRTATGEISDTVSSTGLVAGIDQPFGRQRFSASGSVDRNRHRNRSELDNTGYELDAGLDWSTIEHLSGSLSYNARRRLADLGLAGATADNVEKTQQLGASARWAVLSKLAFEGSAERRSVAYSGTTERDNKQNVARLGLVWGTPGLLTLGVGGRITKGESPNRTSAGVLQPDESDRKDLDLTAMWSPTGLSTINARLSATRETHSEPSIAGFSGATGRLAWDYRPTGKLSFTVAVGRDTGSEITFTAPAAPGAPTLRADVNRVVTIAELGVRYAATAKISVSADAHRSRGASTTTLGGAADSSSRYALAARYEATRAISLGCSVGHEERESVYKANTAGCFGQLTLR